MFQLLRLRGTRVVVDLKENELKTRIKNRISLVRVPRLPSTGGRRYEKRKWRREKDFYAIFQRKLDNGNPGGVKFLYRETAFIVVYSVLTFVVTKCKLA